jgi:hypothetical protein
MNRDVAVLAVTLVGFALLVTAHVVIAAGLLARRPRWRAPLALIVAPLAPILALRAHMVVRAATWLAALAMYATGLWLARG